MTYGVVIMYLVAAVLGLTGVVLLVRLGSATISERQVYAYRMIGIMLTSAGIVLAMSATAMWRWSMA
ncbi:hypothetical protein [Sphingomonas mollis]|uniref:HIG1 domain-containing protein n=1 Tax=Sphingomonas mollis TaxID=2795726 RepID=A0ABS0XJZ0_9SPHN|nr:hypothetical protein [Sphingomonas sp. BT553]MBJ6120353.1 hypothetical protein [Sphingomonas sp. BT553]